MMKIVIFSISHTAIGDTIKVYQRFKEEYPGTLHLDVYNANHVIPREKEAEVISKLEEADLVFADLMSAPGEMVDFVIKTAHHAKGFFVPMGSSRDEIRGLLRLGALTAEVAGSLFWGKGKSVSSDAMRDFQNYQLIMDYWHHAGEKNIENLFYLFFRNYGDMPDFPKPEPPQVVQDVSIYDPRDLLVYADIDGWLASEKYDPMKPTVAILFIGHHYPNSTASCVAGIMKKLQEEVNLFPIAFSGVGTRDLERLKELLIKGLENPMALIINFLPFRIGAGPIGGFADVGVEILKEANVPVFHPFFISKRTVEDWEKKQAGIQAGEFIVQMMLPELDGSTNMIPVGALHSVGQIDELEIELQELTLIDERVDMLVNRVLKWVSLQKKLPKERKVGIICYNYPPGEGNLFGGSFLDTFASVSSIIEELHQAGYDVDALSPLDLQSHFTAGKLVNSARWSGSEAYQGFIRYSVQEYEKEARKQKWYSIVKEQWGDAPGDIMAENGDFLIPGIISNNVFIGLQPSRGVHEDPDKTYHDDALYPHHQYIAFYYYLKYVFKADVILHVGTHGTLEFLPGKENAMSGECMPDYLISDLPHLYFYYVGNPAEAMIAKRRTHGTLFSYQSPPFIEADLYGELSELELLIHELHNAMSSQPERCPEIRKKLAEKAEKANFPDLDEEGIEQEIYRLKRSLIPRGLHILGKGYNPEEAESYMRFVLRYDRGLPSLRRLLAEDQDWDYDQLMENKDTKILSHLDEKVREIVREYVQTQSVATYVWKQTENAEKCQDVLSFGIKAFHDSMNTREMKCFLDGLNGKYIPVRLAGDIVRYPDILPSGYNLYQFDPRLIPTETAYERGWKLAEQAIKHYYEKHGAYPKSTAIICWGLETSRTQGETVGQILAYLGIRVVNPGDSFEKKYKIIPLSELKRPRINVVVNICGFFRDMFPNIMDDLNELCKILAHLDEPESENYFKAFYEELKVQLATQGFSEEHADELAYTRLFGPEESGYGTNVIQIIETKNWESESQLGDAYVNSLYHVYTKSYRGKAMPDILTHHLKAVDIVSQVRSNHEYEITDLDHYYEFFGGLSKAVETAKGYKAEMIIHDTTGEGVETDKVEDSISRGVRTRLFNPKWIDGMLEHKYHGVQKIAERFENILGLSATTNRVEQWVYHDMHKIYVQDEQMRERLTENNRWAYMEMLEHMFELNSRGYWDATEGQLNDLRDAYMELEGSIEENLEEV